MITEQKFNDVKRTYGYVASWAIWSDEGELPKSNIGDLNILDPKINGKLLSILNPNVILVGLNITRGSIKVPFANFHDNRSEATDFKIRFGLRDTILWGGYMTDIIKNFDQKSSGKVAAYLKEHQSFEKDNVERFRQELLDVGSMNPILIAFGNDTFNILNRNFHGEFKIIKIPHYASYVSKETYRKQVLNILSQSEIF